MNLCHLAEQAQIHAVLPTTERIQHVHAARWIGYPLAEHILGHLQRLMDHPTCARMPCMLLYGESGIGKTMILEKFSRGYRSSFDHGRGRETHPVVIVEMPAAPDERRLYAAVLEVLRVPLLKHTPLWSLERTARTVLREVSVRALFIDEVNNLLAGSQREQRRSLNVLKSLANHLRIPVIAVGTREAVEAVQTDAQIASRFEPMEIPRWSQSEMFRAFLLALERELPLQKASLLAERECTQLLLRRSEGITGRVCWILGQAAEEAIRSGTECITLALIEQVSQRLRPVAH